MRLRVLSLILATTLLTGCAIFGPSVPHASIDIQSAKYLNPDINGNPSPIVVTIYELKNQFAFKQASYDALATNSSSILGGDLIDQQTIEVRPDTVMSVSQPLSPNTQYLGIVAAYRNIDQATWRTTVAVPSTANSFDIRLSLESQGLSVTNH
jgi:type VI secretion system protein VasD